MKKLLFILLISLPMWGQAVRYDNIAPVLNATSVYTPVVGGAVLVYAYPGPTVNCAISACTAAVTYIDQTEIAGSCGAFVPLTRPTANVCVSAPDVGGNFGFWIATGKYQYCISGTGVITSCTNITVGPDFSVSVPYTETTAPASGATGFDLCYGDSTAHGIECSYNNGAFGLIPLINTPWTWTAQQTFPRVKVAGTAPTCAFTSGGGTAPSCGVDTGSTDTAGIIIATTGTGSPAGTGTVTLTFSSAFGTNKPVCQYQASDNVGTWNGLAIVKDKTPSTTTDLFTWTNGTTPTALTASTAYWINYQCWAK